MLSPVRKENTVLNASQRTVVVHDLKFVYNPESMTLDEFHQSAKLALADFVARLTAPRHSYTESGGRGIYTRASHAEARKSPKVVTGSFDLNHVKESRDGYDHSYFGVPGLIDRTRGADVLRVVFNGSQTWEALIPTKDFAGQDSLHVTVVARGNEYVPSESGRWSRYFRPVAT